MKFAVIETGGKQYKIKENQEILIERIPDKKEKDKIILKNLLSGKDVIAHVLGEQKGKKVFAFKYRSKNRYRKKTGHRQIYFKIKIDQIN